MASTNSGLEKTLEKNLEKTSGAALDSSLQVADVVLVSVDTRAFSLAASLASRGWKTVVIELSGVAINAELEWSDRLGPFQAWEDESIEPRDAMGLPVRSSFGSIWLPSGPVAFGGHTARASAKHLAIRYGGEPWSEAMMRSLVASRLLRQESYFDVSEAGGKKQLRLPLDQPVKAKTNANAIAKTRREHAISAGVRILEAEQISAVRLSDRRIDRVEFQTVDGLFVERTRSLVWMLSEEESRRVEFVGADVPLEEFFESGKAEPLMAWWRSRIAIRGTKNAPSPSLARVPETPPHVVVVGAVERPWTHDNAVLLDLVEETPAMKVFDVWTRIPYWSRADHVYRDEQRLLMQALLKDRFVGCELIWVTPSPLALASPSVRMPHVLYSESTKPAQARLDNICFAGPETWAGVAFQGLKPCEAKWLSELEAMRIQWDPVARLQASRFEQLKYKIKNIGRTEVEL